jgi:AP-3 complex subunit delta-1
MTTLFQAKYIAQCIEEIKQELRQDNVAVKANAVAKLTYVSSEHVHCQ